MINKISYSPHTRVAFKADVKKANVNIPVPEEQEKTKKKIPVKKIVFSVLGIALGLAAAAGGVAILVHSIKKRKALANMPPRQTFEELLAKNNLEFKDNLLINKETKEGFTGALKRSTGAMGKDIGYEEIETQVFKSGVITEKTYHDLFGRELRGEFFENGVLREKISVFNDVTWKLKGRAVNLYDENGELLPVCLDYPLCKKNITLLKYDKKFVDTITKECSGHKK